MADTLLPHSSGDALLNFKGDDEQGAIRAAFGADYWRLVDVKTKYDPVDTTA